MVAFSPMLGYVIALGFLERGRMRFGEHVGMEQHLKARQRCAKWWRRVASIPREGGCVADLKSRMPLTGLLPMKNAGVREREVDLGALTLVMSYRGREPALSNALEASHGLH